MTGHRTICVQHYSVLLFFNVISDKCYNALSQLYSVILCSVKVVKNKGSIGVQYIAFLGIFLWNRHRARIDVNVSVSKFFSGGNVSMSVQKHVTFFERRKLCHVKIVPVCSKYAKSVGRNIRVFGKHGKIQHHLVV